MISLFIATKEIKYTQRPVINGSTLIFFIFLIYLFICLFDLLMRYLLILSNVQWAFARLVAFECRISLYEVFVIIA